MESFKDQGFSISLNPYGDSSCQFSALSYFLQKIGIHRSARSVPQEVVNHVSENPKSSVGQPSEKPCWVTFVAISESYGTNWNIR